MDEPKFKVGQTVMTEWGLMIVKSIHPENEAQYEMDKLPWYQIRWPSLIRIPLPKLKESQLRAWTQPDKFSKGDEVLITDDDTPAIVVARPGDPDGDSSGERYRVKIVEDGQLAFVSEHCLVHARTLLHHADPTRYIR